MRWRVAKGNADQDKEFVDVKNTILITDKDNDLIAVFLFQLTLPTEDTLSAQQTMSQDVRR